MSKGLRFFGTNYNALELDGTPDASSSSANAQFAFDGLRVTKWISSGQGTDGNSTYLEMNYGVNRTIQCFFVYQTNIRDIQVEYWNGAAWVVAITSNSTLVKSADLGNLFVKLNTSVTTSKVRIIGSTTITANQEKYVTLFFAFPELGQLEYFPNFTPKIVPKQDVFSTTDGRGFVIERGEAFAGLIDFTSHVNQNDITLAETLFSRKEAFFIWPNGGDESIFRFQFKPFRFQDIYKVTIVGENAPAFTKNYYKAGYNNQMNLVEVV